MTHDENLDKKLVPENNLLAPPANENLSQEQIESEEADNEQDLDDLVHSGRTETVPENEEIDNDDAVHNAAAPSFEPGTETDPDDLVHGN